MSSTTAQGKSRPSKPGKWSEKPVEWRDVMRVLPDDETRSYALSRFFGAGFTADKFSSGDKSRGGTRTRWRLAREAMADALTRTEDWLECKHSSRRDDIRDIRRRLEWELWP